MLKDIMERALIIDLETTINASNPNHFGATPFDPANNIVLLGTLDTNNLKLSSFYNIQIPTSSISIGKDFKSTNDSTPNLLWVGHNIPFDLHYSSQSLSSKEYHQILSNINIWDTMIAEYYITRQECKSISLENLAKRYGITFKKDPTVSESFKAGIGADKIDPPLLKEYLKGDLETTALIFLAQQREAIKLGGPRYVEYLLDMMGARVTTMLMERNGCTINTNSFTKDIVELTLQVQSLSDNLENEMRIAFRDGDFIPINKVTIGSPLQVSTYLFGGEIKLERKVETGHYKSGERKGLPKFKKDVIVKHFAGAVPYNLIFDEIRSRESVDSKTLEDLLTTNKIPTEGRNLSTDTIYFIENLLLLRTQAKDLGTYETYRKQFFPGTRSDTAILHPNFNHALTHTKRPSCSGPNLQNVSNKETVVFDKDTIEIEE